MAYLVGADEAGYGPNLGPLVITATVWQVPDELAAEDLFHLLRKCVSASPTAWPRRLPIADSKVLYKAGLGLAALERGVLAALALVADCPTNWLQLWKCLDPVFAAELDSLPWHLDYEALLPLAIEAAEVEKARIKLQRGLAALGIRLIGLRSVAVFPGRFNALTEQYGNKSEALSKLTLGLVAEVLAPLGDGAALVHCDKHGGRDRYGRLLQEQFTEWLVEVHAEGSDESVYCFGPAERRVRICFRVRGEELLPIALASMASKYLREVAMGAFNAYWLRHIPDLRPTAGYPGDSRRFKRAIEGAQAAMGIDDRILWRNR